MCHLRPPQYGGVGNQAPVASPPQGFGAHHRDLYCGGLGYELVQSGPKLWGVHVVCVGTKRGIAPGAMAAVLDGAAAPTQLLTPALVAEPGIM